MINTVEKASDSTEKTPLSEAAVSVETSKVEVDVHFSKDGSQHPKDVTGKGPPLASMLSVCKDMSSAEELLVAGLTKVAPLSETCSSGFKQDKELRDVPLVVGENVVDHVATDEIVDPEFSSSNKDKGLSDVPPGVDQIVDVHIAMTENRTTELANKKEISNVHPLMGQNVEVQIATEEGTNLGLQAVNEEESIYVPPVVGSSLEIHAAAEDSVTPEPSATFPACSSAKNLKTIPEESEPTEKSTVASTGKVDVSGVLKAPETNTREPSLLNKADVHCRTAENSVDLRQSAGNEPPEDRLELSNAVHIDLKEDSSENKSLLPNTELISISCPSENSSGVEQSEPEKPLDNSCEEVNVIVPAVTEENNVSSVLQGETGPNFMAEPAEGFAEQQVTLEKPLAEDLKEASTVDASIRLMKNSASGVSEVNAASSLIGEHSEEAEIPCHLDLENSVIGEGCQEVKHTVPGIAQERISEQAGPVDDISGLNSNIVKDSVTKEVSLEVNATLPGGSQEEDNEKAASNSVRMEVCQEANATLPNVAQEVDKEKAVSNSVSMEVCHEANATSPDVAQVVDTEKAVPVNGISDLTCSDAVKISATSEGCQEVDVTVSCVAQELDTEKDALRGLGQDRLEESSLVELSEEVNNAAAPFDAQEGFISFEQADTVDAKPLVHNPDKMPVDLGQDCLEKPLLMEIPPVVNNDTPSISLEEVKSCEQTEPINPELKVVPDLGEDGPEKPLITESQDVRVACREENSCEKISIHVETNDTSAATELSSDSNQTGVDIAVVEVKMKEYCSTCSVTHAVDSSFGDTITSEVLNMDQTKMGDLETAEPACRTGSVEHDASHSETGAASFAFDEAQKVINRSAVAAEAAHDESVSGLRSPMSVEIGGQEDSFSANDKMNGIIAAVETGNKNVTCSDPSGVASHELDISELRKGMVSFAVTQTLEVQEDVSAVDKVVDLGGGSSIHFDDHNVGVHVSDLLAEDVNIVEGDAPNPALTDTCALGVESGTSVDYVDVASRESCKPNSTDNCKALGFADKAVDDFEVVGTGVVDISVTSSLTSPDPKSQLDGHFAKSDNDAVGVIIGCEAFVDPLAEEKANEQEISPVADAVHGEKHVLSGQDDPVTQSADLGQGEGHLEASHSGDMVPGKLDPLNGSSHYGVPGSLVSASSVNHVTMDTSGNSHIGDKTASVAGTVFSEETEEKTFSMPGDSMRLEKDGQCTVPDQSDDKTLPNTAVELSSLCQETQTSEQKVEESDVSVVVGDCPIEVDPVKNDESSHLPDNSYGDNSQKVNNSLNARNVVEVEDTRGSEGIPIVTEGPSISESLLSTSSELQIPVVSEGGDPEIMEGQSQSTSRLRHVKIHSLTDPQEGQSETIDDVKMQSRSDPQEGQSEAIDVKMQSRTDPQEGQSETIDDVKMQDLQEGQSETIDDVKMLDPQEGQSEIIDDVKMQDAQEGLSETIDDVKMQGPQEGQSETIDDEKMQGPQEGQRETIDDEKMQDPQEGQSETIDDEKMLGPQEGQSETIGVKDESCLGLVLIFNLFYEAAFNKEQLCTDVPIIYCMIEKTSRYLDNKHPHPMPF
ncbi:hypothetical protein H6P81_015799 [Aristolochia fimbriata]|uniref:Uncharacterized protein n=1 Tax=Aristolochia fimbriata TaxID=158543 RepID=A0AAV7E8B6_ARIFI|nr:hypothetical protein H6P81_015799 [Aristolochia fimbriata]